MVLWAPLGHLNLSQSLSSELLGTPITTILQNIKLFLDRGCLHTRLPNLIVAPPARGCLFHLCLTPDTLPPMKELYMGQVIHKNGCC